jgi:hypothetical protein
MNVGVGASLMAPSEPGVYAPLPSNRVRASAAVECQLTPHWSLTVAAGEVRADERTAGADSLGRGLRVMRDAGRSTFRIQSVVGSGGFLSLRNRCEFVSARGASDGAEKRGILLQADLMSRPFDNLSAALRCAVFAADDWTARVYSPEQDVGGFHLPAFVGRGVRFYALVRWKPAQAVALSCRYGATFQETIPAGPSRETEDSSETRDVSLQLDVAW